MHCGQANRFIKSLIVLASLFSSGFADLHCPIAESGFSGIGDELTFSSASKLSVLGFSATVNYSSLPVGK
jgi:hypothetical protein